MHLYAPGDHEYISVGWPLGAPDGTEVLDTIYPEARMMHLPATIPLKWTFTLEPHDLERAPEGMRRGAAGS